MKLAVALAFTLALASTAQAAVPRIMVNLPWSRPAVAGGNAVGYMILENTRKAADVLVKAQSPFAARVEMHATTMAGGVMSMARQDRVVVPACGSVTFGPGAYHLMLIGLTKTVKLGDQIPITLTFASGLKVEGIFPVYTKDPEPFDFRFTCR